MKKQLNIKVFGKVQGVYFRQSTKEKADSLNIKGVVLNEADGSVFISALGDEESLTLFLTFCKIGPPSARVDNVVVEEVEEMQFTDFKVIR